VVVLKGVSGVPEPKPERPADVRARKDSAPARQERAQDDLLISSEAQAAARLAQLMQMARTETDIRADRVAAAKERIDRGDYKRPEVVAKVAEKVSKYLP